MNSTRNWRLVAAALSLLVIGGVLGIAFDRLHHRGTHTGGHVAVTVAQPTASLEQLEEMLDLRPDQRDTVRAILEARQPAINDVWRQTHESLRSVLDSTMTELSQVLDERQRQRLEQIANSLHNPRGTSSGPRTVFRH